MNSPRKRKRRPMRASASLVYRGPFQHTVPMRTYDEHYSKTILTHSVHELFYLRWWNTLRAKIKVSLQKRMKAWGPCAEESTQRRQQIRPRLYNFKGLMSIDVRMCTRHYWSSFLFRTNSLISEKKFLITENTCRLKWCGVVIVMLYYSLLVKPACRNNKYQGLSKHDHSSCFHQISRLGYT